MKRNLKLKKYGLLFFVIIFLIFFTGAEDSRADVADGAFEASTGETMVAQAESAALPPIVSSGGECWGFDGLKPVIDVENCVNQLTYTMFKGMTVLVTYSGMAMDFSFAYSAIEFGQRVSVDEGLGTVMVEGWSIFRDLANIIFIFLLLYAAIGIIIGLNIQAKKIVGMVVIIAIIINFSYFLTSLVIDASNILALQFHKALTGTPDDSSQVQTGDSFRYGQIFMESIRLGSFYDPQSITNAQEYAASIEGQDNPNGITEATARLILGFIMLVVAMFIFLAAAILFLIRMIVLIFLLMLSPLAFVASILPNTKQYFSSWWNTLLNQAFFAPVFFMLLWISIKILQSDGFTSSIGLDGGASNSGSAAGTTDSIISIAVGFTIAIGFLIFSLLAGKKMGAIGANSVIGTGNKLKGWGVSKLKVGVGAATFGAAGLAGRQIAGRGSAALADRAVLNKWAQGSGLGGVVARATQRTLRRGASASYDARNAPGLKGAAAALGIGAGAGAGGYTAGVQKAAEKQAEKAKLAGTPTLSELNEISAAKERKDDAKKMIEEIESSQEYKNREKNANDAKEELEKLRKDLVDAKNSGNNAAVNNLNTLINSQKRTVSDTQQALKDWKNDGNLNGVGNISELNRTITTLGQTIAATERKARERQRAQTAGIGGLTSWATRGTFSRERVRAATRKKLGE